MQEEKEASSKTSDTARHDKITELAELAGCPLLLQPWPVSLCELAFVCYRFTLAVSHTRN